MKHKWLNYCRKRLICNIGRYLNFSRVVIFMVLEHRIIQARGREILSKASQAGYAKAALQLALRFKSDKMYEKAWPLFEQAASDEEVDAMFYMALMHLRGNGTERDPSNTIQFLDDALERGCSKAAYHLMNIYLCGEHVPVDYRKKNEYMELAQSISEKLTTRTLKLLFNDTARLEMWA